MEQVKNNVTFGENRIILNNNSIEIETRLTSLREDVDGLDESIFDSNNKIKIDILPDAPLSPEQFEEYDLNGVTTLRLKDSFLIAFGQAQGWGGTPLPTLSTSVVTFGTSTTTSNIVNWSSVPNATNYVVRRSTSSGMIGSTQIYSGALLTFTDTGLTASTTYYYTVTASATGYNSSTSTVASKGTAAESGGNYVVNRRIRMNLTSEYGASTPAGAVTWNDLKRAESLLQTANSVLASNVVTETNQATTIGLTNPVALASASNSIFSPEADGIYPFEVVGSGWGFDRDGNATLRITGLDDTKYYHIYLGSTDNSDGRSFIAVVNGESKTKANFNTIGTVGGDEFTSNYNTEYKNKQSSTGSINIVLNYVGFFQGRVGAIVIEESNMLKP